jgi:membrane protease YdiL (CAAX protease family)
MPVAFLALPIVLVVFATWLVAPDLVPLHGASPWWYLGAVAAAPLLVGAEYAVAAASIVAAGKNVPRGFRLPAFWNRRLTARDWIMLTLVAAVEEIVYRSIWLTSLERTFALALPVAIALSSVAYGLNHLAFGRTTVASKSVAGAMLAGLYVASGRSVLVAAIAHAAQNVLVLQLGRRAR